MKKVEKKKKKEKSINFLILHNLAFIEICHYFR